MATIKKISGLSSTTTPGSTDKLLIEDSSGNLKYTTVGDVRTGKADLTNKSQTITAKRFMASSDNGTIDITSNSISATNESGTKTNYFHSAFGWMGPIAKTLQINDSSNTHSGNKVSLMDGTVDHVLNLPSTIEADITGNVSGSSALCTGNASSATRLKTSVQLKTTDGTNTSTGVNFDGSAGISINLPSTIKASITGDVTGNVSGSSGSCTGNAATATKDTALGDDFGFHQRANTESSSTKVTFRVTPDKAYLLFQTHSNHYGMYLISTYAKGYTTIIDNNDGLTGLSVNNAGNKITVTSSAGRLSLIMVGRNT